MAKSSGRNIKARRKLKELYARGHEVRFGPEGIFDAVVDGPFTEPPTEEQVAVFVSPPSPLQREQALRDAQATRARAVLAAKRDEDSEAHLTAEVFVAEMEDGTLREYLLGYSEDERQQEAQRDVLREDEWSDFTDLQDAMRQWRDAGRPEPDDDDTEWRPLLERDKEFGRQVRARQNELRDAAYESLKLVSRSELERRALEKRVELVGSQRFVDAYERQMLFYACRDPEDTRELFFEHSNELAELPEEVIEAIAEALNHYISEGSEAKNSPRAESGSEQSEPPVKPEISEASTPETVNA